MVSLRYSVLLSTLLMGALSSPARQEQAQQDFQRQKAHEPCTADKSAFHRLLASVDESSLHSALHDWSSRFKDGIYNRDRSALEAVHSENAPVATSLLNLAKRQDTTNDTSSTPPPTSSSRPPPASSSRPPPASSSPPVSSASPPPPVTVISTSTLPAAEPSTTRAPVASATPSATAEPTEPQSTTTPPAEPTTTSDDEVMFIPTSSTIVSTFTLPDGGLSTLTSVTIVDSPVTGGGIGAPDSSATAGGPSLQDGAASIVRRMQWEGFAIVGAVIMWGLVF